MAVRVPTRSSRANPFIVCDKRPDVNRVAVKLSELRQHRIAGDSIAAAIATQIDTHGATRAEGRELRWELGVFRGHHHSSHMVMTLGAEFEVSISGHLMPVGDLLVLQGGRLVVDRRSLVSLVDNPASGGGSRESKQERCQRLRARRQELRGQHVRGFVKQIAAEERLSVSRVKQILAGK